jgi:peptide/nickel transport system ATP-binding protein
VPEPLLSIRRLTTEFRTDRGAVRAVDDVSFDVPAGETLAVVGESGCGKSVTALSVLRLISDPPGRITGGQILFHGRDVLGLGARELEALRGGKIAMIFQEPMSSLNPVYTVGQQIVEALRLHRPLSRSAARARAVELLTLVGIPAPAERIDAYPHQLSGGMRQRVMIAMALACDPELLLADEPTTALDVTIQAQILDLLRRLQQERGMSVVLITHDLGVVAECAEHVVVMYAGRVVERARTRELFASPQHPYTRGLLGSVLAVDAEGPRPRRLPTIEGMVPDLARLGPGCRFAERCVERERRGDEGARCLDTEPELRELGAGRAARCHFAEGVA